MSALSEALERILSWWGQHPPSEYASVEVLEPGLTYEEIEERVANLPFRLPREVYELYQWRNGTCYGEEEFARFFIGRTFLSLESALEKYDELTERAKESYDLWEVSWFPIFEEADNRGYYFIEGTQEEKETSPVFSFVYEAPDIVEIYSSLTEMILKIKEEYEIGG